MKKKVLLISVMAFVLACVFAFSISAENPVFEYDTNRTAVLSDGTPVNLYDESGKALSYYYNGNGELVSDLTVNLFKWNVSGWLEMKDTAICSAANVVIANWQDPELEKTAFSNYGLNISFRHSTSLQQVYFSNIMQKMNGEYVFSNCDSMTIFEFTDESLFFGFGRYTFYDSDALLELNIPKNVTCFSDAENGSYGLATKCDSLHTVTFVSNENMQKINAGAFRECPKLVNITIPDSVTYVGNEVFRSSGIVNSPFTVNSKCTSFGKFICRDCDSLKSFIIPGSLQSFAQDSGYGPLAECAGEELVVSWGTYADPQNGITKEVISYFFGQAAIKSVIIPEHITTIKANAFKNCGGVELIKVPNSVTIIEERAFEKCEQLKTLILGDGLTHFVNTTTDHGSLTYGTPVTTIYLPASFYSEAPETAYRVSYMFQCNGNANVKIFYTGSKEKLNNAIKNFVDGTTNSNDNNAAFISGEQVSYAAYLLN